MDAESVQTTLKILNLTNTNVILMKLRTIFFLHEVSDLLKTWFVTKKWLEGVNKKLSKTSQNIRFLSQFLPFFKTTRTNMPYLMHYLTLHH